MSEQKQKVNPWYFDPSMPSYEDCVLKGLLDSRARDYPDRMCAMFEDGTVWTYAECRELVRAMAQALQARGVQKGERVIVWLPNVPELIKSWFAINYIGGVFVPINTAYRGGVLQHVINNSSAELMVIHTDLIERLTGLDLPNLNHAIVVGNMPEAQSAFSMEAETGLGGDAGALEDVGIERWDIQSIIYTSGTTGPSKGVLSPYLHMYTTGTMNYGYIDEGDCILNNFPMFHVGGTGPVYCALVRKGAFYLVDGFSTDKFWDQIRKGNCSSCSGIIGAMGSFLYRTEPKPDDADNPLRCVAMFPIDEQTVTLGPRFGFDHVTGFNMTEVSTPLFSEVNSQVFGGCGKPRTGVSCRIVDENDIEVPIGEAGELIVRSDLPWTMNAGYLNMPEATARAWRNGWFHTGDGFRQDKDGNFFFVDRLKDTIRRRGENISSLEVEAEVRAYPAVLEVIAVGVKSEFSEEEVLIAVIPKPDQSIDPEELTKFLIPRLAYFMVPRYVRIVDDIPKTETGKPRKVLFRDAGVTEDAWDREAAGIKLQRERLGK